MSYRNLSMEVGTYYRRPNLSPHLTLYYQSGEKYTLTENDLNFYSMQVMYESEMTMILLGDV